MDVDTIKNYRHDSTEGIKGTGSMKLDAQINRLWKLNDGHLFARNLCDNLPNPE